MQLSTRNRLWGLCSMILWMQLTILNEIGVRRKILWSYSKPKWEPQPVISDQTRPISTNLQKLLLKPKFLSRITEKLQYQRWMMKILNLCRSLIANQSIQNHNLAQWLNVLRWYSSRNSLVLSTRLQVFMQLVMSLKQSSSLIFKSVRHVLANSSLIH